jgi:hypothetical protein
LAALALLLASTGASAQAPAPPPWNPKAPENTQLLATFNYATIEAVLKSIGATFRRTGTNPAKPSLLVTFRNGRRAVLALSACDDSGANCKAMNVQTTWSRVAGAAPERTSQSIAQFNRRYAYAKAFLIGDGQPTLQRYLTADYGYVRGNLAVDLLVFADQAQRFTIEVLQPLQKAAK